MTSSKISDSIYNANIPDVSNFSVNFVYNYWTKFERTLSSATELGGAIKNSTSIDKLPRYVSLAWDLPVNKTFTFSPNGGQTNIVTSNFVFTSDPEETSETIGQRVISEDDDFSPQYISQNFSDIASISQGAADFQNYLSLVNAGIVSNNSKQKQIIQNILDKNSSNSKEFQDALKEMTQAYDALSDFPADLYGLNIFNAEDGLESADDRGFFKNLASSLIINFKIHRLAIPDFLAADAAIAADPAIYKKFDDAYQEGKAILSSDIPIPAYKLPTSEQGVTDITNNKKILGYLIYRYVKNSNGLKKDDVFYISDGNKHSFIDTQVLYGKTYVYSISTICELDILGAVPSEDNPDNYQNLTLTLASRPATISVDCLEFKPPPPPGDINFLFDYTNRNVILHWDFPVNPQHDIKQFQVLRRRNINEPFELIAQYGFDDSVLDENGLKYLTGEIVDVNNLSNMQSGLKYLAIESKYPAYRHIDTDFVIDTDFFETTSFIYAFCSIDAHGMISNYSAQYEVKFDPFKNKLFKRVICDEGSPRSYPNMNLKIDVFKDAINVYGDQTKQIKVYFSPEYFRVQSETGDIFNVVESNEYLGEDKAFYLMQFMNLDNQKTQTLKMLILKTPDEVLPP